MVTASRFLALLLAAPVLATAADIPWDIDALSKAPTSRPAEPLRADGMKGVFFDALPHHGKPTRVFAWIGIPKTDPGKKVPGIVLVHGGGGTAFEEWVRLWTGRGYAAIAFDACGSIPVRTRDNRRWVRDEAGGPPGWGGWDQIDAPQKDQWTYHAVADAMLAHSLLAAQPGVDADRIGITGISWGGYLTCIVAGIDARLKFAAPVYGCGFTDEHTFAGSVQKLGPERAARWMEWWDPKQYLPGTKSPMLWVNGTNDFAYTMNAHQKSYRLPATPRTLAIRPRMPHAHGGPGENPKEIHVFAESIVNGGDPLPKWTSQGREGAKVWAEFESKRPIKTATLHYTKSEGPWPKRLWEESPATLLGNRVEATLPESIKAYYLNITDDRDCVSSTEHEEP